MTLWDEEKARTSATSVPPATPPPAATKQAELRPLSSTAPGTRTVEGKVMTAPELPQQRLTGFEKLTDALYAETHVGQGIWTAAIKYITGEKTEGFKAEIANAFKSNMSGKDLKEWLIAKVMNSSAPESIKTKVMALKMVDDSVLKGLVGDIATDIVSSPSTAVSGGLGRLAVKGIKAVSALPAVVKATEAVEKALVPLKSTFIGQVARAVGKGAEAVSKTDLLQFVPAGMRRALRGTANAELLEAYNALTSGQKGEEIITDIEKGKFADKIAAYGKRWGITPEEAKLTILQVAEYEQGMKLKVTTVSQLKKQTSKIIKGTYKDALTENKAQLADAKHRLDVLNQTTLWTTDKVKKATYLTEANGVRDEIQALKATQSALSKTKGLALKAKSKEMDALATELKKTKEADTKTFTKAVKNTPYTTMDDLERATVETQNNLDTVEKNLNLNRSYKVITGKDAIETDVLAELRDSKKALKRDIDEMVQIKEGSIKAEQAFMKQTADQLTEAVNDKYNADKAFMQSRMKAKMADIALDYDTSIKATRKGIVVLNKKANESRGLILQDVRVDIKALKQTETALVKERNKVLRMNKNNIVPALQQMADELNPVTQYMEQAPEFKGMYDEAGQIAKEHIETPMKAVLESEKGFTPELTEQTMGIGKYFPHVKAVDKVAQDGSLVSRYKEINLKNKFAGQREIRGSVLDIKNADGSLKFRTDAPAVIKDRIDLGNRIQTNREFMKDSTTTWGQDITTAVNPENITEAITKAKQDGKMIMAVDKYGQIHDLARESKPALIFAPAYDMEKVVLMGKDEGEFLVKATETLYDTGKQNRILKDLKGFTSSIVKMGLGTSIAWFSRNVIGGEAYFSYLNGLRNPAHVANAFNLLRKGNFKNLQPEQINSLKTAIKERIIGGSFWSRQGINTPAQGKISGAIDTITNPLFRANAYVEDAFKYGNWLDLQKRGYTIKQASEQIRKIFGDPARMNTPMMKVGSQIFTFANWTTHSLGSTLWALVHRPQKINRMGQLNRESMEAQGIERKDLSYTERRKAKVYTGRGIDQETGLDTLTGIPMAGLFPTPDVSTVGGGLKETALELGGMLVPYANLIVGLISQVSLPSGYALKGEKRAEWFGIPPASGETNLPEPLHAIVKEGTKIATNRNTKLVASSILMPLGKVERAVAAEQQGKADRMHTLSRLTIGVMAQKTAPFSDIDYSLKKAKFVVEDLEQSIGREFSSGDARKEETKRIQVSDNIDKLQKAYAEYFGLIPEPDAKRRELFQSRWLDLEEKRAQFLTPKRDAKGKVMRYGDGGGEIVQKATDTKPAIYEDKNGNRYDERQKGEVVFKYPLSDIMGSTMQEIKDGLAATKAAAEKQYKQGRGGNF